MKQVNVTHVLLFFLSILLIMGQQQSTNGDIEDLCSTTYTQSHVSRLARNLGPGTWTLLHRLAANFSENPSEEDKRTALNFIQSFAILYPCRSCARDFEEYINVHPPNVTSREAFSLWMCDAHNEVNQKLGKPLFDCSIALQVWSGQRMTERSTFCKVDQ